MSFSNICNQIFSDCTAYYHTMDSIDANPAIPFSQGTIECSLFIKNWIDAVQWHLEDIIRNPRINPIEALELKRRIDKSNQDRTDLVEMIDSYFLAKFKGIKPKPDASLNTESPAWAIDRLSILALKIFHMEIEVNRVDVSVEHIEKCKIKLNTLIDQRADLSKAIDQLLTDIEMGHKYMKVYRQMKMYNDPALNPILYSQK